MNPVDESSAGVVALLLDDLAPPRLGTFLRSARKQHLLTRRDVANQIGTTASELRRYERGDAPVPPSLIASLAECYGEDLTAQFVARIPIQIDAHRIVVDDEEGTLESEDSDEMLGTYVGIVARLRNAKPGEPIALRTNDLVALSNALGQNPEHVEARIVELLGCTPQEARSLHTELLRRKLVLPIAGLVTGLAVVAGVGVAASSPVTTNARVIHAEPAAATIAEPAPTGTQPPTTVAAPAPAPAAAAGAAVKPATPPPDTTPDTVAPAATEAPTTMPPAATREPAPATDQVETATAPVERPVITPDTTPMSIPAHESVTIIQP